MLPIRGAALSCVSAVFLSLTGVVSTAIAGAGQQPAPGANPGTADVAQSAFNSAKELGTAEAWNAFLTTYPTGFYADLARAYLNKQTGAAPATPPATPVAAAPAGPVQEVSCAAQSTLRSVSSDTPTKITFVNTSGMYRSILWIDFNGSPKDYGGLNSGQELTLDTFVTHPWMIATGPGDCLQIFMPSAAASRVDLRRLAADTPPTDQKAAPQRQPEKQQKYERPPQKKKPLVCGKNYKLRSGQCVLVQNCGKNAYRSAEGDCHCNNNYMMRNGKCIWKQDKQGFEVAPWKKGGCKAWQNQCSQGNNNACGQYEANCQVN